MQNFLCGLIVGAVMLGSLSYAGQFYDSNGQPSAPSGSIQQFDYFRQRQQQLDIEHMRKLQNQQELDRKLRKSPC